MPGFRETATHFAAAGLYTQPVTPITIRFATLEDAEAICTIFNQGIADRVATLDEFRECLKKPLVLKLTQNGTPWRPEILVDDAGAVYFHSLLVGRFPAAGSSACPRPRATVSSVWSSSAAPSPAAWTTAKP